MACSYTCMLVSRHSLSSTHMCCCVAWHHTPLPCRWKKWGHWCVESNRRERVVKMRCCDAHRRGGWHWLRPRCQQVSVHCSGGGGGLLWQCTAAAASCPHRHEEGEGVGGEGGVLLCDRVLFRCCCRHPCYPCGSSLASKRSLLVCWGSKEREREKGESSTPCE